MSPPTRRSAPADQDQGAPTSITTDSHNDKTTRRPPKRRKAKRVGISSEREANCVDCGRAWHTANALAAGAIHAAAFGHRVKATATIAMGFIGDPPLRANPGRNR